MLKPMPTKSEKDKKVHQSIEQQLYGKTL